jgi:hypothetical protein
MLPLPNPRRPKTTLLFFMIGVCILGLFLAWNGADFLDLDEAGNVNLSPARQAQMQQRLKRLKRCEQYVLRAKFSGFYPCYNCGADTTIFLYAGEVWKYGITIQGETGRYRHWTTTLGLRYRVQYRGSIQACLRQEALKIYQYALLPENIKRAVPLIRPPGNKADL